MPRLVVLLNAMALVILSCGGGEEATVVTSPAELPVAGEEVTQCESGEIDGDLHLYNWAEYIDPQLIAAFEEEYEVDVVEDFYASNEALAAKMQSGAIYDLIVPSDYMVRIMIEEKFLAAIQTEALPNLGNLAPLFLDPAYDPGGVYSVAYQWGTVGLAVSTDVVVGGVEASWALLFDPTLIGEYPSGVSLLDDPRQTLGAALKYLGYSLNSTNEEELLEAAGVIATAREYVVAFDSDSYDETLATGQVDAAHGSSKNLGGSSAEVEVSDTAIYLIPEEGAAVWIDAMAVPANADYPCTAHTFINFVLEAENGATLTNWTFYASPNEAAEEYIDPQILEDEAIYPSDGLSDRLEIIEDTDDFEINYKDYFAIAKS
ncbi:MAG: spermidine/putrescine ABC transporter substrate-binding protein [Acidimicrobiia bacterium]